MIIFILNPSQFEIKLDFLKFVNELTPKKQEVKSSKINYNIGEFLLSNLFEINSGDYHSVNNLKDGKVPLISCSDIDNGIVGFYNIPENKTYKNCITIAYDGKPLTTKFHNYKFSAYDNVGVLTSKKELRKTTFIFITILLNIERWRYGYGRKCYKQKLERLKIKLPITNENKLDEYTIENIIKNKDIFGFFK